MTLAAPRHFPLRSRDLVDGADDRDVAERGEEAGQGHGGELETVETYRGTTVKMELVEKVPVPAPAPPPPPRRQRSVAEAMAAAFDDVL